MATKSGIVILNPSTSQKWIYETSTTERRMLHAYDHGGLCGYLQNVYGGLQWISMKQWLYCLSL